MVIHFVQFYVLNDHIRPSIRKLNWTVSSCKWGWCCCTCSATSTLLLLCTHLGEWLVLLGLLRIVLIFFNMVLFGTGSMRTTLTKGYAAHYNKPQYKVYPGALHFSEMTSHHFF